LQDFKSGFIKFVIDNKILRFGNFTLKSGRISPYFFNAGLFNTGAKISFLAKSYADAIVDSKLEYDVLFGPAYKGIPLVTSTVMALANKHDVNKPYCFNRKEAKDHGEGGLIVGSDLEGKALIIDDVITAGTAIREAADIIDDCGAVLGGIIVAIDRQEKGAGDISAIEEVENTYKIKVISIVCLDDIIHYLRESKNEELTKHLDDIVAYRQAYGV
jgi:orotate phosphoribosyltransferase